jgi:hypothetical protein
MTGRMTMERLAVFLAVSAALVVGCDRGKPANQPAHATTIRPDGSAPPVEPTDTRPASRPTTSTLLIADREYTFPAARLVLQQVDPTVDLLLFSGEARAALAANYTGNRYHLLFKLDIEDIAKLGSADYVLKASTMDRMDSPDGIFLEGDKKQLQAHDIHVQFSQAGRDVRIEIQGLFLMFGGRDEHAPPVLVPVQGVLTAELEDPRKPRTAKPQ